MSEQNFPVAWDMEKEFPEYSAKISLLHRWMGAAIDSWSNVETTLFRVYTASTGLPQPTAASMMLKMKSFSLALDLTDSAVRGKISKGDALIWWKSLVDYLRELSGDRNFIAHNPVVAQSNSIPMSLELEKATPIVSTSMLSHAAGEYPRGVDLGSGDVQQLAYDFRLAQRYLHDFADALENENLDNEIFIRPVTRRRPSRSERLAIMNKGKPNRGQNPEPGPLTYVFVPLDSLRGQ
jgi:hypothetical protein